MSQKNTKFSVCVLAHNEETHIVNTLLSILNGQDSICYDVIVYANGCTDRTACLVEELSQTKKAISIVNLAIASKTYAWNTAFSEHIDKDILIFSDGDIEMAPTAIRSIYYALQGTSACLVGCNVRPKKYGLTIEQRFVGFLQTPLHNDFLSGALYGIKVKQIDDILKKANLCGIPLGIVGEDSFLQSIVDDDQFMVLPEEIYYDPPSLSDYFRYLARIRWQEEQLKILYAGLITGNSNLTRGVFARLKMKLGKISSWSELIRGISAVLTRILVRMIFAKRIEAMYRQLGPISCDGKDVLRRYTRSNSTK